MSEKPPPSRSSLLCLLLGAWLGGSAVIYFVVVYNFAGFEDMFERNPPLAEHAGFDVDDVNAKKSSLLWVHSSELNRVFFEVWGVAQLAVGALALVVAVWRRQGGAILGTLIVALALCAWLHFVLTPEIIDLGRAIDFKSRDPAPPQFAKFGEKHGLSLALDGLRLLAVVLAATLAVCRGKGGSSGS